MNVSQKKKPLILKDAPRKVLYSKDRVTLNKKEEPVPATEMPVPDMNAKRKILKSAVQHTTPKIVPLTAALVEQMQTTESKAAVESLFNTSSFSVRGTSPFIPATDIYLVQKPSVPTWGIMG